MDFVVQNKEIFAVALILLLVIFLYKSRKEDFTDDDIEMLAGGLYTNLLSLSGVYISHSLGNLPLTPISIRKEIVDTIEWYSSKQGVSLDLLAISIADIMSSTKTKLQSVLEEFMNDATQEQVQSLISLFSTMIDTNDITKISLQHFDYLREKTNLKLQARNKKTIQQITITLASVYKTNASRYDKLPSNTLKDLFDETFEKYKRNQAFQKFRQDPSTNKRFNNILAKFEKIRVFLSE